MRKTFSVLPLQAIMLFALLFVCACANEKTHLSPASVAPKPTLSVEELLLKSIPSSRENLVSAIYTFAQGVKQASKDKTLGLSLLKQAKESPFKEVNIRKFINNDPDFKKVMEHSFAQKLPNGRLFASQGISSVAEAMDNMAEDTVSYQPVIYIPNIETADFNLPAIVAIGEQIVEEGNEGELGLEGDIIAGWDEFDQPVLLDEKRGTTLKNPVLIVGAGGSEESARKAELAAQASAARLKANPPSMARVQATHAKLEQFNICCRYDGNKSSEYSYILKMFGREQAGSRFKVKDQYCLNCDNWPDWQITTFAVPGFWLVTFEYDWFAENKWVEVDEGPEHPFIAVRMTGQYEYYQRIWVDQETIREKYEKNYIRVNFFEACCN